jgi:adenine-specific DNA-methyltransferase
MGPAEDDDGTDGLPEVQESILESAQSPQPRESCKATVTVMLARLERKSLGAFYTPPAIAEWLAGAVLEACPSAMSLTALDPACGDGQLLASIRAAADSREVRLVGVDLDERALHEARRRLGSHMVAVHADSLGADAAIAPDAPTIVIANPPWGSSLPRSRAEYASRFTLARGQFDSFDLFVELAVNALPQGGVLGLVLPDALLLPEHEATRRLLLARTHLLALVRLGEGLFEDVFRGALLVVARRGPAPADATVRCARLHFAHRDSVASGNARLRDVLSFHDVPQSRLLSNPHAEFDLDVRSDEAPFFKMRARKGFDWGSLVKWSRGIEIGKEGRVYRCPKCGVARAEPKAPRASCARCGAVMGPDSAETIVRPLRGGHASPKWAPLIVGSDVRRYHATPSRRIRLEVPGVQYKGSVSQRKLLVRKTGVGLQAAVDETGAQTVQSVFHATCSLSAPSDTLDFLLGVLNSRPMQAFYLRLTGDHEWRSHPYVTPRVLRALPIPPIAEDRRIVGRIGRLARAMSSSRELRTDLRIDEEVADLYGIGSAGIDWSHQVLSEAEQLRPIARLAVPKQLSLNAVVAD